MEKMPAFRKLSAACEKAHQSGWIKLLDGRMAKSASSHSAINTLIQGDGSVLFKYWVQDFRRDAIERFGPQEDWGLLAMVHDEMLIEARTMDLAEELGRCAVSVLQQTKERLKIVCPLGASYDIGLTWGDIH